MSDEQPIDFSALLEQAQQMQSQLMEAQAAAAEQVVEGTAGGGMVKITVNGGMEFQRVTIDPRAVDPDDVAMLEDLVLAALHDALAKVNDINNRPWVASAWVAASAACSAVDAPTAPLPRRSGLYAGPVQDLIDELGRLPGVGPKSAQRIAFHLLKLPKEDAVRLARSITEVKERITFCARCFNISEGPQCSICADERRDATVVCVVEEPRDIVAVEKTREYRGRYHVLQGAISPIEGIGPDQLRVRELLGRIDAEGITEVILCTNPNIEGDATAMYLASLLKPLPVKVTRIASGLPVGGDLEYADELTLGRALEGRREVDA